MNEIIKFLDKFSDEITINTLEDNKYLIAEGYPFKKDNFIEQLKKIEFTVDGIGENEFYITILDNSNEITFQIKDFEFTDSIFDII